MDGSLGSCNSPNAFFTFMVSTSTIENSQVSNLYEDENNYYNFNIEDNSNDVSSTKVKISYESAFLGMNNQSIKYRSNLDGNMSSQNSIHLSDYKTTVLLTPFRCLSETEMIQNIIDFESTKSQHVQKDLIPNDKSKSIENVTNNVIVNSLLPIRKNTPTTLNTGGTNLFQQGLRRLHLKLATSISALTTAILETTGMVSNTLNVILPNNGDSISEGDDNTSNSLEYQDQFSVFPYRIGNMNISCLSLVLPLVKNGLRNSTSIINVINVRARSLSSRIVSNWTLISSQLIDEKTLFSSPSSSSLLSNVHRTTGLKPVTHSSSEGKLNKDLVLLNDTITSAIHTDYKYLYSLIPQINPNNQHSHIEEYKKCFIAVNIKSNNKSQVDCVLTNNEEHSTQKGYLSEEYSQDNLNNTYKPLKFIHRKSGIFVNQTNSTMGYIDKQDKLFVKGVMLEIGINKTVYTDTSFNDHNVMDQHESDNNSLLLSWCIQESSMFLTKCDPSTPSQRWGIMKDHTDLNNNWFKIYASYKPIEMNTTTEIMKDKTAHNIEIEQDVIIEQESRPSPPLLRWMSRLSFLNPRRSHKSSDHLIPYKKDSALIKNEIDIMTSNRSTILTSTNGSLSNSLMNPEDSKNTNENRNLFDVNSTYNEKRSMQCLTTKIADNISNNSNNDNSTTNLYSITSSEFHLELKDCESETSGGNLWFYDAVHKVLINQISFVANDIFPSINNEKLLNSTTTNDDFIDDVVVAKNDTMLLCLGFLSDSHKQGVSDDRIQDSVSDYNTSIELYPLLVGVVPCKDIKSTLIIRIS